MGRHAGVLDDLMNTKELGIRIPLLLSGVGGEYRCQTDSSSSTNSYTEVRFSVIFHNISIRHQVSLYLLSLFASTVHSTVSPKAIGFS